MARKVRSIGIIRRQRMADARSGDTPPRRPGIFRWLHRGVQAIEPWGIMLAVVALMMSLVTFWIDYQDRVSEREVRAWQLLTTKAPGNSGKISALEYLNSEDGLICWPWLIEPIQWLLNLHVDDLGTCVVRLKMRARMPRLDLSPPRDGTRTLGGTHLRGARLAGASFVEVNFRYADLAGADLSTADLQGADLLRANLRSANLEKAILWGTNLGEADLGFANLEGAILWGANLKDANLNGVELRGANLRMADLTSVRELTQRQLDGACGDKFTILPPRLTIRPCPE